MDRTARERQRPPVPPLILLACAAILASTDAPAADAPALLAAWLGTQTNLQSWKADVVQTRELKALAQPLVSTGHVWFVAPNRFRWELGDPPQTIAIRLTNALQVFYPRLRRAERYPLDSNEAGPWREALALVEAGFPRSQAELEQRFRIVDQSLPPEGCQLTLEPRTAAARRWMPRLRVTFSTNDFSLLSTALEFRDGSVFRNEFRNAEVNPPVPAELLSSSLPPGTEVITPPGRRH